MQAISVCTDEVLEALLTDGSSNQITPYLICRNKLRECISSKVPFSMLRHSQQEEAWVDAVASTHSARELWHADLNTFRLWAIEKLGHCGSDERFSAQQFKKHGLGLAVMKYSLSEWIWEVLPQAHIQRLTDALLMEHPPIELLTTLSKTAFGDSPSSSSSNSCPEKQTVSEWVKTALETVVTTEWEGSDQISIEGMERYFRRCVQQKPWATEKTENRSTGRRELLSENQVAVVSRHLAETHSDPFEVLVHGRSDSLTWIQAAVKELIEANCAQFRCPICFDG